MWTVMVSSMLRTVVRRILGTITIPTGFVLGVIRVLTTYSTMWTAITCANLKTSAYSTQATTLTMIRSVAFLTVLT